MSAQTVYVWGYVGPGVTVSLFIHGYGADEFVAFDVHAQRSPSRPGAFKPQVTVDTSRVGEHVDGTLAHWIVVTNTSTSDGAPPTPVVTVTRLRLPLT